MSSERRPIVNLNKTIPSGGFGYPHRTASKYFLYVCLQDLDSLQVQLEEVRFFDLFAFSEEAGGWLCFMCNNPEKATGKPTHTENP